METKQSETAWAIGRMHEWKKEEMKHSAMAQNARVRVEGMLPPLFDDIPSGGIVGLDPSRKVLLCEQETVNAREKLLLSKREMQIAYMHWSHYRKLAKTIGTETEKRECMECKRVVLVIFNYLNLARKDYREIMAILPGAIDVWENLERQINPCDKDPE